MKPTPGGCQLKKMHLKIENYVLFSRLSEDFKPKRKPLCSETLFPRGRSQDI